MIDRPPILPPRWVNRSAPADHPWRRLALTLAALGLVAIGVRSGIAPANGEEAGVVRPAWPHGSPVAVRVAAPDPCPIDWRTGPGRLKSLIACEANVWDVPGGAPMAFAVAHCESRFETAVFNPTGCGGSGCAGVFQQNLRYWAGRAAEYGFAGAPPTDALANVVVSMRMASERGTWARDWPVCGR